MSVEHLVQMANEIANFFASDPDHAEAANSVAAHIKRFWDPRMRRQILLHLTEGGADLSPIALAGVGRLRELDSVVK
jgi:formate dehydrogenase subunit delta